MDADITFAAALLQFRAASSKPISLELTEQLIERAFAPDTDSASKQADECRP